MKKKLILIGGTMGVGKTATSRELHKLLLPSAFLDGDWCWDLNPFIVNEENKAMVMDHICHLLQGFLTNSGLNYVIFCWVMHQQQIIDDILRGLEPLDFELLNISLTCQPRALRARFQRDAQAGLRQADAVQGSIARLPLYDLLDTIKLDVTAISPLQAAAQIAQWAQTPPA